MKNKKRIKKGLTLNQVRIIAKILSILIFAILTVLFICNYEGTIVDNIILIMILVFSPFIFYVLLFYSLGGWGLSMEESHSELEAYYKEKFSKESLVEVSLRPKINTTKEDNMILAIIEREGYKFYAKFEENDELILVVKDKNNEEAFTQNFSSYFAFKSTFKIKGE